MDKTESTMAQQLAQAATTFQSQQTGHAPSDVTVVLSEDTLVITLHDALSPAEQALASEPGGSRQPARVPPAVVSQLGRLAAERNRENHRPKGARGGRRNRSGHRNCRACIHNRHTVQVFLLDGRLARWRGCAW